MHEINDSGLSSHIDKLAEEGFKINPIPFDKLAAWTRIMLQLATSSHSLERLENFDSQMRDADNAFLQVALLHSFILQYGKCFTSVGSGRVKLDANTVFKGNEELRATHERIMKLRHNTFAHNDIGDLLRADILVRENKTHFLIKHTFTMAIPKDEFPRWRTLNDHVQQYTTIRLNKRLDDLQSEIGKPIVLR
jgi:hypothetical protein